MARRLTLSLLQVFKAAGQADAECAPRQGCHDTVATCRADEAAAGSNTCLTTLLSDSEGSLRGAADGDRLALLLPTAVAPGDLARDIVRLQAAAAHLLPGLEQLPNCLQMLLLDLLPLYSSAQVRALAAQLAHTFTGAASAAVTLIYERRPSKPPTTISHSA